MGHLCVINVVTNASPLSCANCKKKKRQKENNVKIVIKEFGAAHTQHISGLARKWFFLIQFCFSNCLPVAYIDRNFCI